MTQSNACTWCDKPALFHLSRRVGDIPTERERNTMSDHRRSEVARSCQEHKLKLAHWWLQGK